MKYFKCFMIGMLGMIFVHTSFATTTCPKGYNLCKSNNKCYTGYECEGEQDVQSNEIEPDVQTYEEF